MAAWLSDCGFAEDCSASGEDEVSRPHLGLAVRTTYALLTNKWFSRLPKKVKDGGGQVESSVMTKTDR